MAHVDLTKCDSSERIRLLNGLERGRVVRVNLSGAKGREEMKVRPCVVVSNAALNKSEHTVIVVPISTHGSNPRPRAYEIALAQGDGELDADACAIPHQVRTVDRFERVVEIWGALSPAAMQQIDDMLAYDLGLTSVD